MNEIKTYIFENFKFLYTLNKIEEQDIMLNDEQIIKAYYKALNKKFKINYDVFLKIIKNISIEQMITPLEVCVILYKNLIK